MGDTASISRAMMVVELEKLRAPLVMLNALSRCLADEPEDLEIRRSLTALVFRKEALEADLSPRPFLSSACPAG